MHATFNHNFMHALVDQANLKPEPRPVDMFKDFLPNMYKEDFENICLASTQRPCPKSSKTPMP